MASQRLHVLGDPVDDAYGSHQVYAPGQSVTLPDSVGAPVTFDVGEVLKSGQPEGG